VYKYEEMELRLIFDYDGKLLAQRDLLCEHGSYDADTEKMLYFTARPGRVFSTGLDPILSLRHRLEGIVLGPLLLVFLVLDLTGMNIFYGSPFRQCSFSMTPHYQIKG
jgi:hypothetical protein